MANQWSGKIAALRTRRDELCGEYFNITNFIKVVILLKV